MMHFPCQIKATPFNELDELRELYPDRSVYLREQKLICPSREDCKKVTSAVVEHVSRDGVCNKKVEVITDLVTGDKRLVQGEEICSTWGNWRKEPVAPPTGLPQYPSRRNPHYLPPRWPQSFSQGW